MRGLIICRWDDRIGVILENAFPESARDELLEEDRLTIFSTHALSEKAGVIAMRIRRLNVLSYYSGLPDGEQTDQFYVALLLDPDENPDQYEERLQEIANMVIPQVGKPGFDEFFAKAYEQITKFQKINDEQRFAFIFQNRIRRILLERLTRGAMTKEGLAKWISKQVDTEVTDIDGLLNPLRKTNLIEEVNISKGKKVTLEFVFLVRDAAVIRAPHVELFLAAKNNQMAPDIREQYISKTEKFFKEYRITGEDTEVIAEAVANPDYYAIIQLLREEYMTKEEIPMKLSREIDNLDEVLRWLAENNIVTAIKDKKGRVWVMLLSDVKFPQFFPEYLVDEIRKRWKEGTIQKQIALKHLRLLRAEYIATQAPKYRKKMLANIYSNLKSCESFIDRNEFDKAATILDTVAEYLRDMGERRPAEIVDESAKLLREDKMKYIEESWVEDRIALLEFLKEIEEKDEEKLEKKKKKQEKAKGKEKSKKKDSAEYVDVEDIEDEDEDVEEESEELSKKEKKKIQSDIDSLSKTIKKAQKKVSNQEMAELLGELASKYLLLGDEKTASQIQAKAEEYLAEAEDEDGEESGEAMDVSEEEIDELYEQREQLQDAGRSAFQDGDYGNAAQAFGQCLQITQQLVEYGYTDEADNITIYEQLIARCQE